MKKHIICLGDSNTHGYCTDISESADHTNRFNEDERWTCLLQKALGDEYLVIEEGLGGRTTVFQDPLHESMDALSSVYSILMSHEPVDLLIIVLGTNDTKDRFSASPKCISIGLERLVQKCRAVPCWRISPDGGQAADGAASGFVNDPKILIVCPQPIGREMLDEGMGVHCAEKSERLSPYYADVAARNGCAFLDAAKCKNNTIDYMHLSLEGHRMMADLLTAKVRELV
ncbi:MAG: GDSL-type esterase/lipase family protein [Eubacteriales bacterium]|nr:GDSL-type esterase/lipase family protein [Eubacteriales bacterium]